MKTANIKKRRLQRARKAKEKNPISAVKTRPKEDPRRVALEARQRVLGVPPEDAAQPEASTVLGRLKLSGVITDTMYEAGKRYLELYLAYLKAIKAPTGLAVTSSAATEAEASEEYVDWAIRAVAHYEVMKAALEDWQLDRQMHMTAILDWEPTSAFWLEDVRDGLSLLARKMGLENLPRAA